jgi:hypothetical protein
MNRQSEEGEREWSAKGRAFREYLETLIAGTRYLKVEDLLKEARVPASSASMVFNGNRSLPNKYVLGIARLLHNNTGMRFEDFVAEIAEKGAVAGRKRQLRGDAISEYGSTADRVLRARKMRALLIENSPFVRPGQSPGFMQEWFDVLAKSMRFEYVLVPGVFSDMEPRLKTNSVHIVVTAVLPNSVRAKYMDYTRRIPYVEVPLSAIYDRKFFLKGLSADDLFENRENKTYLNEAVLMVVDKEVGDDFAHAYLHFDEAHIRRAKGLMPKALAEDLVNFSANVFVADVATCRAVLSALGPDTDFRPVEEKKERVDLMLPSVKDDGPRFARLASFPVVFGYKKGEKEWGQMLNEAMEFALTEGIRRVISIYNYYILEEKSEFGRWYFRFDPLDESIPPMARSFFEDACKKWLIGDYIDKANAPTVVLSDSVETRREAQAKIKLS